MKSEAVDAPVLMTSEVFAAVFHGRPPAMTGEKMVRKESFWAEHLGEQVINPLFQFVMTVCSKAACPLVLGTQRAYLASNEHWWTRVGFAACCGPRDAAQQVQKDALRRRLPRGPPVQRPSITPDHRMHGVVPNIDRGARSWTNSWRTWATGTW